MSDVPKAETGLATALAEMAERLAKTGGAVRTRAVPALCWAYPSGHLWWAESFWALQQGLGNWQQQGWSVAARVWLPWTERHAWEGRTEGCWLLLLTWPAQWDAWYARHVPPPAPCMGDARALPQYAEEVLARAEPGWAPVWSHALRADAAGAARALINVCHRRRTAPACLGLALWLDLAALAGVGGGAEWTRAAWWCADQLMCAPATERDPPAGTAPLLPPRLLARLALVRREARRLRDGLPAWLPLWLAWQTRLYQARAHPLTPSERWSAYLDALRGKGTRGDRDELLQAQAAANHLPLAEPVPYTPAVLLWLRSVETPPPLPSGGAVAPPPPPLPAPVAAPPPGPANPLPVLGPACAGWADLESGGGAARTWPLPLTAGGGAPLFSLSAGGSAPENAGGDGDDFAHDLGFLLAGCAWFRAQGRPSGAIADACWRVALRALAGHDARYRYWPATNFRGPTEWVAPWAAAGWLRPRSSSSSARPRARGEEGRGFREPCGCGGCGGSQAWAPYCLDLRAAPGRFWVRLAGAYECWLARRPAEDHPPTVCDAPKPAARGAACFRMAAERGLLRQWLSAAEPGAGARLPAGGPAPGAACAVLIWLRILLGARASRLVLEGELLVLRLRCGRSEFEAARGFVLGALAEPGRAPPPPPPPAKRPRLEGPHPAWKLFARAESEALDAVAGRADRSWGEPAARAVVQWRWARRRERRSWWSCWWRGLALGHPPGTTLCLLDARTTGASWWAWLARHHPLISLSGAACGLDLPPGVSLPGLPVLLDLQAARVCAWEIELAAQTAVRRDGYAPPTILPAKHGEAARLLRSARVLVVLNAQHTVDGGLRALLQEFSFSRVLCAARAVTWCVPAPGCVWHYLRRRRGRTPTLPPPRQCQARAGPAVAAVLAGLHRAQHSLARLHQQDVPLDRPLLCAIRELWAGRFWRWRTPPVPARRLGPRGLRQGYYALYPPDWWRSAGRGRPPAALPAAHRQALQSADSWRASHALTELAHRRPPPGGPLDVDFRWTLTPLAYKHALREIGKLSGLGGEVRLARRTCVLCILGAGTEPDLAPGPEQPGTEPALVVCYARTDGPGAVWWPEPPARPSHYVLLHVVLGPGCTAEDLPAAESGLPRSLRRRVDARVCVWRAA